MKPQRPTPHAALTTLCILAVTGCTTTPTTAPLPYMPQHLALHSDPGLLALPDTLGFTHGVTITTGRTTTALAAGPDSLLLVDLAGPDNRCELLLRRDGRTVLYERIGQRTRAHAAARAVTEPFGAGAKPATMSDHLIARIDLYLQRSSRWELDPFTQRFPRQIRLRGKLRLPPGQPDSQAYQWATQTHTLMTDQPDAMIADAAQTLPSFTRLPVPTIRLGRSAPQQTR